MNRRGFASDNNAGVHPEIMKVLHKVNKGHTIAYGDDLYTVSAVKKIKGIFGEDVEAFFVFIGTAANVLGMDALTKPYHSIICADTSHIHEDECGAPERWTGCKLLSVETSDGKLTINGIEKHMYGIGFEHQSQPRVISIHSPPRWEQSTPLKRYVRLPTMPTIIICTFIWTVPVSVMQRPF